MVLPFYKLREQPFGVTSDSRFFFMSDTHREALASLLYGVDAGCGFLALIAPPGLGKTTVLFDALRSMRQSALTVFLFQTVCTPMDLLRSLLTGLGVKDANGNLTRMQLRLKEVLIEQAELGKRVVVVIDEAQNLDHTVLEIIRMLSNFETPQQKLLQIILAGQPQLAEKMASAELEQLRQRISIFAQLKPFSREETQLYIEHRLRVAGYTLKAHLFTREALTLIAESSEGVARNINNLCFNALTLGYANRKSVIDTVIVRAVMADLDDHLAPSELTLELVKRVFMQAAHPGPRMVVFAAIDPGNGCSQIAALTAKTLTGMAAGGVCLVEANFHSPALPRILGSTNYRGLSDALREPGKIRSFVKPVWKEGLWLLSSGPRVGESAKLLASESMAARCAELRKEFDFVIVDAPPLARYPDAMALGKASDGVVVVIEAGSTRRKAARKAVETLRGSGVAVLAAVLNKQR